MKERNIRNRFVTHEGLTFSYDGKIRDGKLKVYRIHGDVTQMATIKEGIQLDIEAMSLGDMIA